MIFTQEQFVVVDHDGESGVVGWKNDAHHLPHAGDGMDDFDSSWIVVDLRPHFLRILLTLLVFLLKIPKALILMMLSLDWDEVHWLLVLKICIIKVILVVELTWIHAVVLFFIFNDLVVLSLFDNWVVFRGDILFV